MFPLDITVMPIDVTAKQCFQELRQKFDKKESWGAFASGKDHPMAST